MITKLLLCFFFIMELCFLIWNLTTHTLHRKEKIWFRIGISLLLFLGLLIGFLRGTSRYLGLICVLLLQAAISFVFLHFLQKKPDSASGKAASIGRAFGAMLLYTAALLPAILFPQYQEPQVTGSHSVAVSQYTWTDENRLETYANDGSNRRVTVKFWYPEEEGTYPLVIFSHGAFGVIDSNYSTCKELASHGYVAVSIAHTYHAIMVEDTDGKITTADPTFLQEIMTDNSLDTPEHNEAVFHMGEKWMEVRTGDYNFVLDTILDKASENGSPEPFGKIDTERIGLFGHSLGGAAAVMVGRQRDDIDAVIDLEGTMLGEYIDFQDGKFIYNEEPYPIPLLHVTSMRVHQQTDSGLSQQYINFYVGEHAKDFHEVIFRDAGHLNFTDLPLVSPPLANMLGSGKTDAKKCIENMNEMVLNYFDYYLKDSGVWNIREEY